MKYVCKRCGHSETHKGNFLKHLSRKKPCKVKYLDISIETLLEELDSKKLNYSVNTPILALNSANMLSNKKDTINSFECEYCKKVFKEKRYLQQHISRNNCKEKDKKEKVKHEEDSLKDEEITLMKQIMAQKDAENLLYKEEMALLRKQVEILMTKIGDTNCNNTTNNTNNTNITNIQINGWGEEDRSHLTDKFYRFCYDRPFTSIQRVIEAVFFNPDYPKNWNIMIKDDKSSKALIYDREKDAWLKKETTGILEDLVHTGYSMLDENFDKQRDANKLTDRLIEKFTSFQDFYAKGDKAYEKRLATEIKELLINYKAYHVEK